MVRLAGSPGRAFLVIFGLAAAVQGFFLSKIDQRHLVPDTRWEVQAVAVSLAQTGRFADPYILPTGPTAHVAPIPPAVSAAVYRLFGLTSIAGYVDFVSRTIFLAALWGLLPWLAARLGLGARAGVLAGFAGALLPTWPSHVIALSALALALLMIAFAQRWSGGGSSTTGALLLGLACGVAFHVQPVLLAVVAGWIAFDLSWSGMRGRRASTALVVLGIAVACLPWAWRNYRTFDAVFFVRSNLGLELRMAFHDGATAAMDGMAHQGELRHPRLREDEAKLVRELGEVVYMRRAGREALVWISDHSVTSAKLVLARVADWWLGPRHDPLTMWLFSALTALALVGVWRSYPTLSAPQRAALLIPLLTYPVVYYVVASMPSYREPLNWLYLLLAAAAIRGEHPCKVGRS